jgi:hypothetical protein
MLLIRFTLTRGIGVASMERNMCLSRRAERLFVQIPIYIAVAFGLSLMLTQFILVLKESLLESPVDWKSFLLLAILVGSVSLIIVAGLAGVGAVIGFFLRALFAQWLARPASPARSLKNHLLISPKGESGSD